MITIILAAAAASASPVCVKLEQDLFKHESYWASVHQAYKAFADISEKSFNELPMASTKASLDRNRSNLRESDQEMTERADRIVTILLANKCKAPDHVPSWSTYPPKP